MMRSVRAPVGGTIYALPAESNEVVEHPLTNLYSIQ